ncbi:MAG TPA: polymer-forming cytoskeletal protein [Pyrinomonadaceae bacterium]|nr:polymer-forming cytoskeletal protein [Pyrinomonadaceae bacterium]
MFEIKRKPNQAPIPREGTTAARLGYPQHKSEARLESSTTAPVLVPVASDRNYQTRTPVITGEINYKGMLPIDGVLTGNLGASGGSLVLKQKTASCFGSGPELSGEISFRDMLRVNGHIAGTVYSKIGTLIVDNSATVQANIEVGVAIVSGTVHGDIVARERVEIGPTAKIHGNIWTRSISIKDGAVFDGICTMLEEKLA